MVPTGLKGLPMPSVDPTGSELADVVSRLRRGMRRAARAADPSSSLSVAQLELLSCLAEHPGARPGQLAKLLRLAASSVTTLVNGLRVAGLITRANNSADRRSVRLDITSTGAAAVAAWQATNQAIVARALGSLPAGSRAALRAALPALRELTAAVDAAVDADSDPSPDSAPDRPTDPAAR